MKRSEWEALDDFGKNIFLYMEACDRFKESKGRYPTQEEMARPAFNTPFTGGEPKFDAIPDNIQKAWAARRKNNPTPGVTKVTNRGKPFWRSTITDPNTGRNLTRRCSSQYDACRLRNEWVRKFYGEDRPDMLINMSKIEKPAKMKKKS